MRFINVVRVRWEVPWQRAATDALTAIALLFSIVVTVLALCGVLD